MLNSIKLQTTIVLLFIFLSSNGQKRYSNVDQPLLYLDSKLPISQVVRTIFQDSQGTLWFGTQNGAFKLEGTSLIHIDKILSKSGKGTTIKDITEGIDGKIWMGHTDGISCIEKDTVINYYESDGLLSNDVWSVTADKSGNIWIGTMAGLCIFDGKKFTEFSLPKGKTDTTLGNSSPEIVHNIFEDSKGILWFCSNAGLFSYANDSLKHVSKITNIQTNFINEVIEDKDGILWISTKQGLYNLVEGKANNITHGKIKNGKGIGSILEDHNRKIWFVSNQHHLYTYDGTNLIEIPKSEDNKRPVIFKIYEDKDHRLWFVGFGGAFRLENGTFIEIFKNGPW
ncbi:MAG: hypothetical protein MK212_12895 [Saprospiraceae bacterium]|nr:hypothetical protein [Saprospiraceae bacterium]